MMYDSKMALAVKANSRVLREFEDKVFIPFGSEYSLLIKNLNSVKAMVRVWIDGTDVTEGTSLVIGPNSSLDLERFIKNGNLTAGNKFKFIERTAAVSDHRGNKVDDGLIRVEFEYAVPPVAYTNRFNPNEWPFPKQTYPNDVYRGLIGNTAFGDQVSYSSGVQGALPDATAVNCSVTASGATGSVMRGKATAAPQSEVGITVAGDVSDQKFTTTGWFATDGVKHVMVMRVLGEVEGTPVAAPVTVKTKPTCASCGKVNKATAKFCSECGTGLQIV